MSQEPVTLRTNSVSSLFQSLTEGRALFLIVASSLLVYANSLSGEFLYDDILQVVQNPLIRSWDNILRGFTSNVWEFRNLIGTQNVPPPYYRPLFTAYLTVGYKLFGLWPQGWHLASLAVHTGATLALYYLLKRLTRNWHVAAIASLLFAIHPTHVESVSWVSGIPDPLAALFFIPALNWYIRFREEGGRRWLALSILFYALATLCKEPTLSLPLIILAWELLRRRESWKPFLISCFWRLTPYTLVTVAYMVARFAVLGSISWVNGTVATIPQPLVWLTVPRVIVAYLLHQLIPSGLGVIYNIPFASRLMEWGTLLPLLFLALTTSFLIIRRKKISFAMWVGLALMLMPLLPALNLRAMSKEWIVQDRYFYLPSIGFSLMVALFVVRAARRNLKLASVLSAAVLIALGTSTILQNKVWHDSRILWTRAVQNAPQSWGANFNLALAYADHNNIPEALFLFERSTGLTQNPLNLAQTYNNISIGYSTLGERDKAFEAAQKAIELDPRLMEAYNNLGLLYRDCDDYETATEQFEKALEIIPASALVRTNMAETRVLMGDYAGAIPHYKIALLQQPEDLSLRYQLSLTYAAAGHKDEAVAELEQIMLLSKDPHLITVLRKKIRTLRQNA
jgi:tetratricopeptide (TPR) repeat protein